MIRQIRHAARRAGIPIEGISAEFFPGQFEVNLAPRDALTACDEFFLFRLLVREAVSMPVARRTSPSPRCSPPAWTECAAGRSPRPHGWVPIRSRGAATVPRSLGVALEALERETELRRILGPEMIDAFLAVKRHEWRRFCEHADAGTLPRFELKASGSSTCAKRRSE